MELDLFSPSLQLAIEYHGDQHYFQTYRGNLREQQRRDQEKRFACEKKGITLLELSHFNWDGKENSFLKHVQEVRPELTKYLSIGAGISKDCSFNRQNLDSSPKKESKSRILASRYVGANY
jgi:hypothetical protein